MMPKPEPSEVTAQQSTPRAPRKRLSRRLWAVIALAVVAIVVVRWVDFDHGVANIATLILGFIATMSLVAWCALCAPLPRSLRLAPLVVVLIGILASLAAFRIDQVSGELVPTLRFRWTPRHDQTLPQSAVDRPAAKIELPPVGDEDFPQFLGPHRDAAAYPLAFSPEGEPKLRWKRQIGAGWSAFSVVGDYAFTMEQRGPEELVSCYRVADGQPVWSHAVEARHETILGGVGPRGTPTVDDGTVYASGATGILRSIDGSTGRLNWEHNVPEEFGLTQAEDERMVHWGRAASPLVVDGLVVVPAGGKSDRPPASLVAYDKKTGKKVWEGGKRQIAYASPSLCVLGEKRQIVIVNEDNITGHDPATGDVLWEHPWQGNSGSNASTSQAVAIGEDRMLISKGYGGGSSVFRVNHEAERWTTTTVWQTSRLLKTKFTNVAVHAGHAFGLSDGVLECVRLGDGERRWKRGRYGHGQVLLVGELLIVQDETGDVAIVDANPEAYRERQRFAALEGKTWNNPALSRGMLLVRNAEEAACFLLPLAHGAADRPQ